MFSVFKAIRIVLGKIAHNEGYLSPNLFPSKSHLSLIYYLLLNSIFLQPWHFNYLIKLAVVSISFILEVASLSQMFHCSLSKLVALWGNIKITSRYQKYSLVIGVLGSGPQWKFCSLFLYLVGRVLYKTLTNDVIEEGYLTIPQLKVLPLIIIIIYC